MPNIVLVHFVKGVVIDPVERLSPEYDSFFYRETQDLIAHCKSVMYRIRSGQRHLQEQTILESSEVIQTVVRPEFLM